jgi:1,2-dihydroxy-3-keto-5-methylthiopentene dioxygenase
MSELKVFGQDKGSEALAVYQHGDAISEAMRPLGVRFERWQTPAALTAGASAEQVLAAYDADIQRLIAQQGYQSVDVVSLNADHPDKDAMRAKFLDEHTHGEDEVRFFVEGSGLFAMHIGDKVYELFCEKGDLISVPANIPHWFDMGSQPHFIAIRLFNNPDGWLANYTDSDISIHFSRLP